MRCYVSVGYGQASQDHKTPAPAWFPAVLCTRENGRSYTYSIGTTKLRRLKVVQFGYWSKKHPFPQRWRIPGHPFQVTLIALSPASRPDLSEAKLEIQASAYSV